MYEKRKIGFVAEKYRISVRTLHYYEDIGLLKSDRNPQNGYRYYDAPSMKELEKILLLRSVDLSMEEISLVMNACNAAQVIQCLQNKMENLLKFMKRNEKTILKIRYLIAIFEKKELSFIDFDQLKTSLNAFALTESPILKEPKESNMSQNEKKLDDIEVRILSLPPCKMISYRAISASPENDAWKRMMDWLSSKKQIDRRFLRYFGFNNPCPSKDHPEYGYEVWVTKPLGLEAEEPFVEKDFPGGLYAVTVCTLENIGERWMQLYHWVKENDKWQCRDHLCLEECLSPIEVSPLQLDLYEPIQKRSS